MASHGRATGTPGLVQSAVLSFGSNTLVKDYSPELRESACAVFIINFNSGTSNSKQSCGVLEPGSSDLLLYRGQV